MKVLISDQISDACLKVFAKYPQIEVLYKPELGKNVDELKKAIADVDALAIRSATKVTADILAAAKNLKVVGRAGIGVDNVDVEAASKKGVIVMNTPRGNMITTAEHAIAMMCALVRSIPQATASIKSGKWEKNKFMGSELFQKTLGIVGCGNIGKIVASRAQGLQMQVIAFDPFLSDDLAQDLGIKKVSLLELFRESHVITVHTPLSEKTKHLINKEAFGEMRKGVYIINCARGGIINEDDLAWAIEQKIVQGAALDVFEIEPVPTDHPLLKLEQVICTPHLGAATEEAQENVAVDVAVQIAEFLTQGTVVNAVNTPSASTEVLKQMEPYIQLAKKMGLFFGQLCEESPTAIHIRYYGDIVKFPTAALTSAILQGILGVMSSTLAVNSVNAPYLAKERGIAIQESKNSQHSDYTALIEVELAFKTKNYVCSGTVFGKNQARFVRYNGNSIELRPEGHMIMIDNEDKPGVMGRVGTYLGAQGVNITHLQLGLNEVTKQATAFYSLSGDVAKNVIDGIAALDGILSARKIVL